MKFGTFAPAAAQGGVLAHALHLPGAVLKKGTALDPATIERIVAAGITSVIAAVPEPGDMLEDEAAARLAAALAGPGVRVDAAFTGRANLFAEYAGILLVEDEAINTLNSREEALTFASIAGFSVISAGQMVGTVKIIPFAVPGAAVAAAVGALTGPALRVAGFTPKRVGVISTLVQGFKPSIVDKTLRVTSERLAACGSSIVVEKRVPHQQDSVEEALRAMAPAVDLVILFGASAITDRRDVIPAALEAAGGRIESLGMPVDPGNLLLLGEILGRPVLGAPGCARSPKENGFDWVLTRLCADVPVKRQDIQRLGVGGLLMEIASRPQPRAGGGPALAGRDGAVADSEQASVSIAILAAGRSSRFGDGHKLLAPLGGRALVRHAADAAIAAGLGRPLVILGHESDAVRAALTAMPLKFIDNLDYASGLASSLRCAAAAAPPDKAGLVVMLGDMPKVTPAIIAALAGAFRANPDALAIVPTCAGRRGNPVLLSRRIFPAISELSGDSGARRLLDGLGDGVIELEVGDAGILVDVDTRAALEQLVDE